MNRKAETFFDAITLLREDLVEEAQNYVFRKKRSGWKTFGSLAACMVLVMSLSLLMLPRGCGSSGGSEVAPNNNKSDSCAPADAPSGDAAPSDGDMNAAPAPEPESPGDAPSTEGEQLRFTAQVLEVLEGGLLVEPFDGPDLERVFIPTAGLEGLPEFYPGGTVMVLCGAISQEDGEAVAEGVTALELLEPESP